MEATKEKEKILNGVNVDQLFSTIDLIKEKPDIAKFQFRAKNIWVDGTYNRATVKDFYGALEEDNSRESKAFDIDEPPVLLGYSKGTNPVSRIFLQYEQIGIIPRKVFISSSASCKLFFSFNSS